METAWQATNRTEEIYKSYAVQSAPDIVSRRTITIRPVGVRFTFINGKLGSMKVWGYQVLKSGLIGELEREVHGLWVSSPEEWPEWLHKLAIEAAQEFGSFKTVYDRD